MSVDKGSSHLMMAKTRDLLEGFSDILKEVELDSQIFQTQTIRDFPIFEAGELEIGPVLGVGGFGVVREVRAIHPSDPAEDAIPTEEEAHLKIDSLYLQFAEHEMHYDVSKAKEFMKDHCIRNGEARYAIKRLRKDLNEFDEVRGMIDSCIEAKLLRALWHPNIVKMRGMASSNTNELSKDFFIVMDRLYGTLDDKMEEWAVAKKSFKGFMGRTRDKTGARDLMVERLTVAYDLAAAFRYIHEHRIVYRDIKGENVGFDVRGDVKVFDFGLCKSLSRKLKAKGESGYHLTPFTGTLVYMAPEVALKKPYGIKVDVYSFGILLWEIMSLDIAYNHWTEKDILQRAIKNSERPGFVKSKWPEGVRTAIQKSWDKRVIVRPSMAEVAKAIRGDLTELSELEEIQNRTLHMRRRSLKSFKISTVK